MCTGPTLAVKLLINFVWNVIRLFLAPTPPPPPPPPPPLGVYCEETDDRLQIPNFKKKCSKINQQIKIRWLKKQNLLWSLKWIREADICWERFHHVWMILVKYQGYLHNIPSLLSVVTYGITFDSDEKWVLWFICVQLLLLAYWDCSSIYECYQAALGKKTDTSRHG